MINLSTINAVATKALSRGGLVAAKYAPEVLTGVGVVGMVATSVVAARAAKEHDDELMCKFNAELERVRTTDHATENDYRRDLAMVYAQRAMDLGKLYGPAAAIGLLSLSCILESHHILNVRNAGLAAAYKLIDEGFKNYRGRVIKEFGKDKDREYRHPETKENVIDVNEPEGLVKTGKPYQTEMPSDYARYFGPQCINWQKDPSLNMYYLKTQQSFANDLLHAHGHVFLNEVYDMLGYPRTKAGAVVGWVHNAGGDDFIDFDLYSVENQDAIRYFNNDEFGILLDFNVDGVILNSI